MTSQGTVLSYPIPAYQNLPIKSDFYQPSRFIISDISLGLTTLITTNENHNYVIGQEVRLLVPSNFGSYQLNEVKGFVVDIPMSSQVILDIDSSTNVEPFIASSETYSSVAQIVAVGDISSGQINSNGRLKNITYIPGSFINISPQ